MSKKNIEHRGEYFVAISQKRKKKRRKKRKEKQKENPEAQLVAKTKREVREENGVIQRQKHRGLRSQSP